MKNFIIILSVIALAAPAFATCPVTGFCAPSTSVLAPSGISDKYIPNNLNDIQKPNAFQPQYKQPYNDMLINTEKNNSVETPMGPNDESSYNANCQFGVCLPGSGMAE